MVTIEKINETYIRVYSDDRGIEQELSEYFTFEVPGAKYMPKYKSGMWDGKVRLYNLGSKLLYLGLVQSVCDFCTENDITYSLKNFTKKGVDFDENTVKNYIKTLKLASKGELLDVRDYQVDTIVKSVIDGRIINLSPTSSGKSLIIYSIVRWLLDNGYNNILLLVPTVGLVNQLYSDFEDYSTINKWKTSENVQKIYSGFSKENSKPVKISTWQSIYKLDKKYFSDIDVVICDETHLATGQSLTSILEKCINATIKVGLSGTLDKKKMNRLVLTGLFGKINQVTTTKQLMDDGKVTKLKINALLLKYKEEDRKLVKDLKYQDELKYIISNKNRNKFIAELAIRTKGNTLVLFQFVEKHGKVLYDIISKNTTRPVYYISGEIDAVERERIRLELNNCADAILIASVQTTSTGINIPSLDNVIFASPTKSIYRVLQSIGRVLRLKDGKTIAKLFDIGDDLSWKKTKNTTLNHFIDRLKIYSTEKFEYKIVEIQL